MDDLDLSIFDNNITISKRSDNDARQLKKDDSDGDSSDDWYESQQVKKSLRGKPVIAKLISADNISIINEMTKNNKLEISK